MASKTVNRGTFETSGAKTDKEVPNLGQVKDLVNRYNKEPVKIASTGEFIGTYADNVLTLNSDINVVDDVTLTVGDAILIKDQLDKTQNGVYVVTDLGTAGTPSSANASFTSTTITNVTVDVTVYETQLQTNETFTYSNADTSWKDSSSNLVDLSTYGITIEGTASDADTITITYVAKVDGTGGVLTRREDFEEGKVILNNTHINVMEGTTNGDTSWTIVSDGVLKVGTSSFTFIKDINTESGSIKVAKANFTGDGATTSFNVAHNLNLTDEYAYLLKILDTTNNEIMVNNEPYTGDKANSITLTFSEAPEATETFKVYIIGLE